MSSKTKIVVLHIKEIIYTAVFLLLSVILILLIFYMFSKKKETAETSSSQYQPGVYTSAITLGDSKLDVEVTVDDSHINAIRFQNLDDSVSTMYPLMQPALEDLAEQIYQAQSLENLHYPDGSSYTCELLTSAIKDALSKAEKNRGE